MDIDDLIYLQNPWFADPSAIPTEVKLPKRNAYGKLYKEVTGLKQIIGLTGLRRVGKSTLVKQIIASLIKEGIDPHTIIYFSFDQPTVVEHTHTIERILSWFLKTLAISDIHHLRKKLYVFFDEIQLVPYWQDIVKRYYDLQPEIKFIITGSASLFLTRGSKESLAGRIFVRQLSPLSFLEYQTLWHRSDFPHYLDFGQFPELSEFSDTSKKIEYLKEGVVGKVLEIDIPNLFHLRKIVDFERLFWSLLPNTGQIINSARLMADISMKKATLFKYLAILEQSLLIRKVLNISGSFRSEKRLLRKLYPASSNFLTLTATPIPDGFKAETYIATLLSSSGNVYLFHHRGKEIDFVLPDKKLAMEVKYQTSLTKNDVTNLMHFVQEKHYQGIVITKSETSIPQEYARSMTVVPIQSAETILTKQLGK